MYLSAKKYIGNWPHSQGGEKKAYADIIRAAGITGLKSPFWSPHLHVEVCVCYWRKANAVHKWFVGKCQDGIDDCKSYYVSREHLEELCSDCQAVLKRKGSRGGIAAARKKMPTGAGFFFGETDYDDSYWNMLDDTVQQVRAVLDNKSLAGFEFTYQSSW